MLEIIRDGREYIIGVCEWLAFDKDGKIDENGEIVVVLHMEINKHYRGYGLIRDFIKMILDKNKVAKKAYWIRDFKYPDRKPREYSREQFERLVGES